jgi:predicted nucleic-acid-binding Zn-ribbon protein
MVVSGPAGPERRRVMEAGTHPSVEGIKQAVQSKGGTLSCPVCGREEFTLVEVTVLGSGMAEQYGTRRQQRAQMVCENCGHVMNFDLAKLRVAGGES